MWEKVVATKTTRKKKSWRPKQPARKGRGRSWQHVRKSRVDQNNPQEKVVAGHPSGLALATEVLGVLFRRSDEQTVSWAPLWSTRAARALSFFFRVISLRFARSEDVSRRNKTNKQTICSRPKRSIGILFFPMHIIHSIFKATCWWNNCNYYQCFQTARFLEAICDDAKKRAIITVSDDQYCTPPIILQWQGYQRHHHPHQEQQHRWWMIVLICCLKYHQQD